MIHALDGGTITIQDATIATELDRGSPQTSFDSNFVIAFARMRLNALDSWLGQTQQKMQLAAKQTDALNDAAAVVAQYSEGFDDPAIHDKIQNGIRTAANKLPEGDPVRAKLLYIADAQGSALNDDGKGGTDTKTNAPDMAKVQKDIETVMKTVDNDSQMSSLYVNQKMGERSEVLQLAATLIQQMNESAKTILSKIG